MKEKTNRNRTKSVVVGNASEKLRNNRKRRNTESTIDVVPVPILKPTLEEEEDEE